MPATIRTRLLLQSLITVAVATVLVVAMVSVALWRLGTNQAQERLALAAKTMNLAITDSCLSIQSAALRITSDKDLSSKVAFLLDSAQKADLASMIMQETTALALRTGRMVVATGASEGSIYGGDGSLICACASEGDRLRLVIANAKHDGILSVVVESGKEPQPDDWQPVPVLATIPLRHDGPIHTSTDAGLAMRNNRWRVEANTPIRAESLNEKTFQMELVQRGLLVLGRPLDRDFLENESGRIGVQLALFANTAPSTATLEGFTITSVPPASASPPHDGMDLGGLAQSTASVAGQASFVCLAPMCTDGQVGGAMALIASQADMRNSLLWTVVLTITAGTIALVVALIIGAMMTRPITRPLATTVEVLNAMAAGDTGRRLPEIGPREMVELAQAVNRTVDGLQQTLNHTAAIAVSLNTNAGGLNKTATVSAVSVRSYPPGAFIMPDYPATRWVLTTRRPDDREPTELG